MTDEIKIVQRCSCCGKVIEKGEFIYYQQGYIYECCSIACLGRMFLNISVKRSTGIKQVE